MRLLLVDDDPDFRRLIQESTPSWLEVVPCASSREAVEILSRPTQRADVAIIDLHMSPHLATEAAHEGWALVRWMIREARSVPVIVATSQTREANKASALEPSVSGVLRKPLNLGLLYDYLRAFDRLFCGGKT